MTEEEIREIADRVIAILRNDSVTIEQLQNTNALAGTDLLELDRGRNVTLDDLRSFIRGAGIYLEILGRNDTQKVPTDTNVFSALRTLYEISKNNNELKEIFLRKDIAEIVRFLMTFKDGIVVGKDGFSSGLAGHGAKIDLDGNGEMESLSLRRFLEVPYIHYNRTKIIVGNSWRAGGGVIKKVVQDTATTGTAWLKLEDGEVGQIEEGDICMGIFHSESADIPNEDHDDDDGRGNFKFAGFYTSYFTITSVTGRDNGEFTYQIRHVPDPQTQPAEFQEARWKQTFHPADQMSFVAYGTFRGDLYPERLCTEYATRTYNRYLVNQNDWEIGAGNIAMQTGDLSNLNIFGLNITGYSTYLNSVYLTGEIAEVKTDGTPVLRANDRGEWVEFDAEGNRIKYDYYDRVSHNGGLWLCMAAQGTTTEPVEGEGAWLCQVKPGDSMTSYSRWHSAECPYPANAMLNMAGCVVISKQETSEPPFPLIVDKDNNYITQADGSYLIASDKLNPHWSLIMDESHLKDGEDGASLEVRYSADKVNWHPLFEEKDKFMQQRVGDGSWSGAMQIVGEEGKKGTDAPYAVFQFAVNDSLTQAPPSADENWHDAPQPVGIGEFLWMRHGIVTPPATTPGHWATARIGGEKGNDGVSVVEVLNFYLASNESTGVTTETTGWTPEVQPLSKEKRYLWNFERVIYSDTTTTDTTPSIKGYYTEDGKGILSITEYYGVSEDVNTEPVAWRTEPMPTTPDKRYLWNYEVIVYTEGEPHLTQKRIIGTHGERGEGYTQHGHWHSGMLVPKLGVVEMGGNSYVAKVATPRPPMFCITDINGDYIVQKDNSYILTGEANSAEYDLFVSKGADGTPGKPGKDGESSVYAMLDNEMDSIALPTDGILLAEEQVSTRVSVYHGTIKKDIAGLVFPNLPNYVTVVKDLTTGNITFKIAKDVEIPNRTEIKITVRTSINNVTEERNLVFTLAGVRKGANGDQGADAVIYRLTTSHTVINRNDKGGTTFAFVWANRFKTVGNATSETTDGTLSYIIDDNLEESIGNRENIYVNQITEKIKFIFRVDNVIVDEQTIPVVHDGEGFENKGHWYSGREIFKNQIVNMGGGSYVCRVERTLLPPLFCIMDKDDNYIVQSDGSYILTGEKNSQYDEWAAKGEPGKDGLPGQDGKPGDAGIPGVDGCQIRVSEWKEGVYYVNEAALQKDIKFIDVAFVRNTGRTTGWDAYICLQSHTSSSDLNYENTDIWDKTTENVTGIFASIILAKNAMIDLLQGNSILIQTDAGVVTAGATGSDEAGGIRFWAGSTFENRGAAPFWVDKQGHLHATDAEITGEVNATSGTFRNVNIQGSLRTPWVLVEYKIIARYGDIDIWGFDGSAVGLDKIIINSTLPDQFPQLYFAWGSDADGRDVYIDTSRGGCSIAIPSSKCIYSSEGKHTTSYKLKKDKIYHFIGTSEHWVVNDIFTFKNTEVTA